MNLNIIGNGFDLYHGLPSSYYYFGCYLIKNNPDFFEELGKIYDLKYLHCLSTYPDFEYEYIVDDIFWSNFEKKLGNINEDYILNTHDYELGLENDDPIELEMEEHLAAESLKTAFANWIKDTLDKEENYEIIKREMENLKHINKKDKFLVFNYTHTLQELYGISDCNILYIHGECGITYGGELIVGHGNLERIDELKEKIESCESEYNFTQKSRNEIDEYKCILRYIEKLKKDVNYCKLLCADFCRSFSGVPENIFVYGMSLGDVDIPYFKYLRRIYPNTKWQFSYYSEYDINRIDEVAVNELGLDKMSYEKFEFKNSLAGTIQEKLIDEQEIETYQSNKNSIA